MSHDLVRLLLRRLANDSLVLRESEVASSLDLLVRLGVLRRAESASAVACRHCGDGPLLPVSFLRDETTGELHGFVSCCECGVDEVDAIELRRWRIDVARFIESTFARAEDFKFSLSVVIPDLLWSIGRANWGERSTEVFFAARCITSDRAMIASSLARRPKTILILPTESAASRWANATDNPVITLESILELARSGFELNHEAIESRVSIPKSKPKKKPAPRRGTRLSDIKLLEKALQDHLRAARDYAIASRDMTGAPKLLPRPTQEELGKLAGLEPYKVTRCMRDKDGQMLRYLWEKAGNEDSLIDAIRVRRN